MAKERTPEQKEARLIKSRAYNKKAYALLSIEQKKHKQQREKAYRLNKKLNETPEQKKIREQTVKIYNQRAYANLSEARRNAIKERALNYYYTIKRLKENNLSEEEVVKRKLYQENYYLENKESLRISRKEYYVKNREHIISRVVQNQRIIDLVAKL